MPEENVVPPLSPAPQSKIPEPIPPTTEKKVNRLLPVLLIGLVLIAILAAIGYWLVANNSSELPSTQTAVTNTPTVTVSTTGVTNSGLTEILTGLETELNRSLSDNAQWVGGNTEMGDKSFQYWGSGSNRKLLENVFRLFSKKRTTSTITLDQTREVINNVFTSKGFSKDTVMSANKVGNEKIAYTKEDIHCLVRLDSEVQIVAITFCGVVSDDVLIKEFETIIGKYLTENTLSFSAKVKANNGNYAIIGLSVADTTGGVPSTTNIYLKKTTGKWIEVLSFQDTEPVSCNTLKTKGFPTDLGSCVP